MPGYRVGRGNVWEGRITKGREESFGGDGYVYYPDCCDGFMVYPCGKLIKSYTLNTVQLLYVNFTSINMHSLVLNNGFKITKLNLCFFFNLYILNLEELIPK